MVKCVKFQRELPGLDEPPWPGELGQRVYENVSRDAWDLWKEHLKMVLNEFHLSPWTKEAQEIIEQQMKDFFFGEGAALPPDYVPPHSKH
jgi:Fe-S cluster biosynthesis and repair protein YggX